MLSKRLKRVYHKGVILIMVLAALLITLTLGGVIITLISSHSRLTYHQVSRIRAYQAAFAAMNLAMENLRTAAWSEGSYKLCRSAGAGCTVIDNNITHDVDIQIGAPGTSIDGVGRVINLTANYTYTP